MVDTLRYIFAAHAVDRSSRTRSYRIGIAAELLGGYSKRALPRTQKQGLNPTCLPRCPNKDRYRPQSRKPGPGGLLRAARREV